MDEFDTRRAIAKAGLVLREMGIEALPVDPLAIAAAKGIACHGEDRDDFYGRIRPEGNSFQITYSTTLANQAAVNFTIAHELGHYFLEDHAAKLFPDNTEHQDLADFFSSDPLEREADIFAAYLLMPKKLIYPVVRDSRLFGLKAAEFLAATCRTSLTAAALRYREIAGTPVAVIRSRGERIEFFHASREFEKWMRGGVLSRFGFLPDNCATWEFNKVEDNIRLARRMEDITNIDAWFEGVEPLTLCEDVVGLGKYQRTLTILYSATNREILRNPATGEEVALELPGMF